MKIYILAPIDPYQTVPGGTRTYILNLLENLSKKLVMVLLGVKYGIEEDEKRLSFDFVPIVSGSERISTFRYLLNLFLKKFILKIEKDAIIHSQMSLFALPFIYPRKKNSIIVTIHGFDSIAIRRKKGKLVGNLFDILESKILRKAERVIFVSDEIKEFYLKKYPFLDSKFTIIPVGVDTDKFKPLEIKKLRKKYGFPQNDKIVMYAGRFSRDKNIELLLNAYKIIEENVENVRLVLLGSGKEENNLRNLSKELKLKNVLFMGDIPHEQLPEILNCADVFALCSLYESGPLVVLEALACGVPAVSTKVGRISEFIRNDLVGKIVDYDTFEVSKAIMSFLNVEDTSKIRETCREASLDFNFKTTVNQTSEVYSEFQYYKEIIE